MQVILGTTKQAVAASGRNRLLIQNLGPGNVFLDTEGTVTATAGLKIEPGAVYEFPTASADDDVYIISDTANTDVRIVRLG